MKNKKPNRQPEHGRQRRIVDWGWFDYTLTGEQVLMARFDKKRSICRLIIFLPLALFFALPLGAAIKPDNVVVIVNSNSKMSEAVGNYYCRQRSIPARNLIKIDAPMQEAITRDQYNALAKAVRARLIAPPLSVKPGGYANDPIQVLVTCYGVPLKILGLGSGQHVSVDAFLSVLFNDQELKANITNPYLGKDQEFSVFRASSANSVIVSGSPFRLRYLVCRLDGYDDIKENVSTGQIPKDIRDMIDRGKASAGQAGKFVLDEAWRGDQLYGRNRYVSAATALVSLVGADNVLHDAAASATYLNQRDVIGYAGFGMHDLDILAGTDWARPRFKWKPGAIAVINESAGGQALHNPLHAYGYKTLNPADTANPKTRVIGQSTLRVRVSYKAGNVTKNFKNYKLALLDYKNNVLKTALVGSDGMAEIKLSDPSIKWPADHKTKIQVYYPDNDGGYHDGRILNSSVLTFTPNDLLWQEKQRGKGRYAEVYLARQCSCEYIRDGCSGVTAAVSEPGIDFVNANITLPRYAKGYTWAEAAYMGTRNPAFKAVVLGDPLMAPYGPVKRDAP